MAYRHHALPFSLPCAAVRLRAGLAIALGALLLAGCAGAPPTPVAAGDLGLPRWVHVTMQAPGQASEDALLAVQAEGQDATRWSLFDPLGMPRARQILHGGKWSNDGFIRPNGEASDMFSAILFAWTPSAALPSAYAGQDWRAAPLPDGGQTRVLDDDCSPRWSVAWAPGARPDTFTITRPDGTVWKVEPIQVAQ
jgi:hypothetical protein